MSMRARAPLSQLTSSTFNLHVCRPRLTVSGPRLRARTTAGLEAERKPPRDLVGSDALVHKVLDLVAHYGTPDYFMENPHSGLVKTRELIAGIPTQVVDYCRCGKPYRKQTSIWTNTGWVPQRPLCKHDCSYSDGRRHLTAAQQGGNGSGRRNSLNELFAIPAELCSEIVGYVSAIEL